MLVCLDVVPHSLTFQEKNHLKCLCGHAFGIFLSWISLIFVHSLVGEVQWQARYWARYRTSTEAGQTFISQKLYFHPGVLWSESSTLTFIPATCRVFFHWWCSIKNYSSVTCFFPYWDNHTTRKQSIIGAIPSQERQFFMHIARKQKAVTLLHWWVQFLDQNQNKSCRTNVMLEIQNLSEFRKPNKDSKNHLWEN